MEQTAAAGRIEDMSVDEPAATVRVGLGALLPRLRRFARALAGNAHDADDLVQAALERALARASQWRPEQRLETWVYAILRNAWIDEQRARGRRARVFAPESAGADVGVAPIDASGALALQAALQQLPGEQREAVALVLVEGLSYREAAAALDVPIGTLTSRLARGRGALQAMLGPAGAIA
jgi:RNA polymerase sigma-70 factor (ECF subfamily)